MIATDTAPARLGWRRDGVLQLRSRAGADELLSKAFRSGAANEWDSVIPSIAADSAFVVEKDDRIIAFADLGSARAQPQWAPEPLPVAAEWPVTTHGAPNALVAMGLWIHPEATPADAVAVRRLTRTLVAQERGLRFCVAAVPLPAVPPHGPAGVVQQIAAGAVDWPPLLDLLRDGYWPIAIGPDRASVVCVWRNEAQ